MARDVRMICDACGDVQPEHGGDIKQIRVSITPGLIYEAELCEPCRNKLKNAVAETMGCRTLDGSSTEGQQGQPVRRDG